MCNVLSEAVSVSMCGAVSGAWRVAVWVVFGALFTAPSRLCTRLKGFQADASGWPVSTIIGDVSANKSVEQCDQRRACVYIGVGGIVFQLASGPVMPAKYCCALKSSHSKSML